MAGVLEQIRRPRRRLVKDDISSAKVDMKILELQIAMDILAEVFGTNVSEIDEMLKRRYEDGARPSTSSLRKRQRQPFLKHDCSEAGEWPMEFCLAE